jgi:predicted component of type VI protein secretion system
MDYSTIDNNTKEELAERVVSAVLQIENLAHVVDLEYQLKILLKIRQELVDLVNDLGGHPAVS